MPREFLYRCPKCGASRWSFLRPKVVYRTAASRAVARTIPVGRATAKRGGKSVEINVAPDRETR